MNKEIKGSPVTSVHRDPKVYKVPQELDHKARPARKVRLVREAREHEERLAAKAEMKLADLPTHTKVEEGPGARTELDRKRAIIEAALAKAKARQHSR